MQATFPLSAAQERLWYAHALDPDGDQYNIPIALDVRGALRIPALSQAFRRVLARHDIMRAAFTENGAGPVQSIRPVDVTGAWMRLIDLTTLGASCEHAAARLQVQESGAAFRLTDSLLFRVTVLKLEAGHYLVLVCCHHIVSDAASLRLLWSEVARAYERYVAGESDGLTPLKFQYADYVSWESQYLKSPAARHSAQFWKSYLDGVATNVGFPTDYPRPKTGRHSGRECRYRLGIETVRRVRRAAQEARCSEFMLMMAGLAALIYRYTARTDFVIAAPNEGRHFPEWSSIIGFFVNLLPVRVAMRGTTRFSELLAHTRDSVLKALEHTRYPFINILRDSKLSRSVHETPYCDVVFQKLDAPGGRPLRGLTQWSLVGTPGSAAKFDLLLNAVDDGESISLICEYNSALYAEERIQRFLAHYAVLLDLVLANPEVDIASLPLLDDGEHQEIVNAWNRTAAPLPPSDLHGLIEAQACATPERIALIDGEDHLTYAGILARVAALAPRVRRLSGAAEFVGIMLERSALFVLGTLALNRIGKAFVPIDPTLPADRIEYILQDARLGTILTRDLLQAEPILMDPGLTDPGAPGSTQNAYCLYSSGSTGPPKGVVVSQRALANYLWWARTYYRFDDQVMALQTSVATDLTITSLFAPLVSGGAIRIYRDPKEGNLTEHILAEDVVDILKVRPADLAPLSLGRKPSRQLKRLIVVGERLSFALAARTRETINTKLTIHNEYGPTEATAGCIAYEYLGDERGGTSVPIGRPILNMEAYLLDERLNPVPRGVRGEIHLAGIGLANAYYHDAALTAEKFLPNPFRAGQRMYRTGDIGVLRFDGQMELRQSCDRQVKVRPQLNSPHLAPGSATLQKLTAIWSKLLFVDEPRADDDFFELGGHSLLAVELLRVIGAAFGVDIDLDTLIRNSALGSLARIIDDLQQVERATGLRQIIPEPATENEPFPLTDTQEAYWVGRKAAFEMGNVAIHGYLEVTCRNLDIHRVEQAWAKLVQRHGMLRAVVAEDATQRILRSVRNEPVPLIDLRGMPASSFDRLIGRVRETLSHEVRALDRWPLFDIRIVLRSESEAVLLMSLEVMNVDESSFLILSEELGQLYRHPETVMPPVGLSFRDYVLGQRDLVPAALKEKSWQYWSQILDELPPGPEVPTARGLKEITTPRFTRRVFRLDAERWLAAQKYARSIHLTPSGVLLAAYAEVLARWSNSRRFTISIPVYSRLPLHPRVNELVGVFTAINLLLVDSMERCGFAERAVGIQERLWRDLDHRFISGVTILRELGRRRGTTAEAAFPYVFTNIIGLGRSGKTTGLETIGTITYGVSQTPQVLVDCQISEEAGGLYACWDSVDEAFPPGMLNEMFRAFEGIVRALASGQPDIDVLVEEAIFPRELRAVRAAVNETDVPILEGTLTHELAVQLGRHANRPALLTSDLEVSAALLDSIARTVAHSLCHCGVVTDDVVGIRIAKGWRQVAAVVGTLYSGAAYVPIDPRLPKDRIEDYLRHGQVHLQLTGADVPERAGSAASFVPVIGQPGSLCYMLYTSGSTGEPKGVLIEHRSVLNRMLDVVRRFGLGPDDRTIAITPLEHDLSVFDMFAPLLAGGAVVVPDEDRALDPAHWAALVGQRKVTIWNSVPAFIELFVSYLESQAAAPDTASLRLILLSGDRIPPKLQQRIRRCIPHAQVVSLGGPTEVTVWDICYPLRDLAPDITRIPYGFPLQNSKLYVLDDLLRDCPVWVTGDLYSSGIGLARGYRGDEALTRASFVTHPRTAVRLYLTGDRARYLPDGAIDIIGRRDLQIKLNGYRVEREEIEAQLNRHPRVARSAVMSLPHAAGGAGLVAYVVPEVPDAKPERLQFRLSQPGLRNPGMDLERIPVRVEAQKEDSLADLFRRRRSFRRFERGAIPRADLATLLDCLAQIRVADSPFPKYRYGSAGNLYPVQTYLYVKPGAVSGLEAGGVYYHHPAERSLILMGVGPELSLDSVGPENRQLLAAASFVILLIARLDAIRPLYGDVGLRYCAIEAGLITQLLEMSCEGTQIGLTQIGGIRIDSLRDSLQLEPSHELMHALIGGRVDWSSRAVDSDPPPRTLPEELGQFLESRLPRALVPRRFVVLDSMPLTRNGKVDREALPAPQEVATVRAAYQAPQGEVELALAGIWQQVLSVPRVGGQDNFFDLGGNSLLLIKASQQMQSDLQVQVSITEMFYHPTIAAMAKHLQSKARAVLPPTEPPEEPPRVKRRRAARDTVH